MLRAADYLAHIREAIQRIDEYTADLDEVGFLQNKLVQDAVIRNFEIIGEACNNIRKYEQAFAAEHPEVPWGFAVGMRNVLAHGYFKVDLEVIWKSVTNDLPELAITLSRLP